MNKLKFFKSRSFLSVSLSVVLSVILVAATVQAATTISTNISTGGTLSVTGASTLTGAVTTAANSTFGDAATDVNLFTGTLQASTTALFTSGLTTYGNSTFGDASTDTNIFTGTLQASTTALFTSGLTTYGTTTLNDGSGDFDFIVESDGQANMLHVDAGNDRVGIASSSPYVALGVVGTTTSSLGMVIGGTGSAITQLHFGTCTIDLGSINASTTLAANCTGATGVAAADRVFLTPRSLENGLVLVSASSTGADVIQASVLNTGHGDTEGAAINPASATWDWMALR